MAARILKSEQAHNIEQGIFLFVVYEPGSAEDESTHDAHGDWATAEEIEKACYNFNRKKIFDTAVDNQHDFESIDAEILESYIAPVEMNIGDEIIKQGTWLAKIWIHDEEIVDEYRSGTKTGLSMAGSAVRISD